MIRLFGIVALCIAACSSGSTPSKPPPPPVEHASPKLMRLGIHVHQLVTPAENEYDEYDYHHMSGYTALLRSAFQRALVEAGYTVVVDRRNPRHIVARIQADWPNGQPGVATLALEANGRVIDQLSVVVPIIGKPPYTAYLEEHAAVLMVSKMSRMPSIQTLAEEIDKPQVHELAGAPTVSPPASLPANTLLFQQGKAKGELRNQPGQLVDKTLSSPRPIPDHPRFSGWCEGESLGCSKAMEMIRPAASFDEAERQLVSQGFSVEKKRVAE